MTKAPERLRIVRVDWRDAHGGARVGWKDVAEAAATDTVAAVSFGVVIRETRKTLVVAPHFVAHGEGPLDFTKCQTDGEIAIPKKWVSKITEYGAE